MQQMLTNFTRITVGQFNELLNAELSALGEFNIEGEVTELKITPRGGVNIVLKDPKDQALLAISGYAPMISGINLIKVGMQVEVYGKPEIYSPFGKFSLKINRILPVGEGALQEAYRQLKAKLDSEGLFNTERKRPLPQVIQNIALITARDSAAQSDFLKILKENKSGIKIDFYPVHVQGKHAEFEIISAIKRAEIGNYDCLVLVRGGGSLEDLIAFNDEQLARAVFHSRLPVIVGVGHERDESIADFVADVRASTPSQAAYYLVTQNDKFLRELQLEVAAIEANLISIIDYNRSKAKLANKVISNSLVNITNANQERLIVKSKIISKHLGFILYKSENYISNIQRNLQQKLINKVNQHKQQLENYNLLLKSFPASISKYEELTKNYARLLKSYNPENVLERGYAIISSDSRIVSSVNGLTPNQEIKIRLKDGQLNSKILSINSNG